MIKIIIHLLYIFIHLLLQISENILVSDQIVTVIVYKI